MKFIGRERELELLNRLYAKGSAFVVLYGRRRMGKTRLLKQFLKDKRGLYFLASLENESLNIARFANMVADFVGMPVLSQATYNDWRPLFRTLADYRPDEPKVVVIDELPYLVEGNRAIASVLQDIWDEMLSNSNVMLVLCGSSVRMMEESVLAKNSPLYGRSNEQIHLKPLSFDEFQQGFGQLAFADQMSIFSWRENSNGCHDKLLRLLVEERRCRSLRFVSAVGGTGWERSRSTCAQREVMMRRCCSASVNTTRISQLTSANTAH